MPKHILVVDDNDEVREIIRLGLEERGHRVTAVKDGASMREQLRDHPLVDAVILDWVLPGERRGELALHAKDLGLPVVIISGSIDAMAFAEANHVELLLKPFKANALIAAILNAFVQAAETATKSPLKGT